ncbi:uncharacterized protein EI90DRAFT_3115508 [Cantharellus anzutake]|uniref:uncharacterized protein n=1 Tax=Cantharellus anzutake TaxID=1750568 RepID=UPI001906EAFF|nr:uncharacterized protein EI90DRAFT_3115508 [Cantharellus anzutake]KAF8343015.1 hypothetical protein EI90DRAFT_3115508 [Cantharellus anzutake]
MGTEYGNLRRLPNEIVLQILLCLDDVSLSNCLRVCKSLSRCILETAALRYVLELAWHGYVDGPLTSGGPHATKAARLQAFRKYMHSWDTLSWTETRVLIPRLSSYEIGGGVYAAAEKNALWCIELPSPLRARSSNDFTFNPKQDLLIAVELKEIAGEDYADANAASWKPVAHVLSFRTGLPHPSASNHLMPEICANIGLMQMRIMGNLYGLLCPVATDDKAGFVVYEWDTGKKLLSVMLESDATSFTFVDERHVIMPSDLKVNPLKDTNLTLYRMEDSGLVAIALFEFPDLADSHHTTILDIASDPSPNIAAGQYEHSDNPSPFEINNKRTIWVHWAIWDEFIPHEGNLDDNLKEFNLVIHTDELVKLALSPPSSDARVQFLPADDMGGTAAVRCYDWNMWGPKLALMMPRKNVPSNNFECFMHGSRQVALEEHSEIVYTDWSCVRYPIPSWLEHHPNSGVPSFEEALSRDLAVEPFSKDTNVFGYLFQDSFHSAPMTCRTQRRRLLKPLDPVGTAANGVMVDAENIVLFEESPDKGMVEMIILTIGGAEPTAEDLEESRKRELMSCGWRTDQC